MLRLVVDKYPTLQEFTQLLSDKALSRGLSWASPGFDNISDAYIWLLSEELLLTKAQVKEYYDDFVDEYHTPKHDVEFYRDVSIPWVEFLEAFNDRFSVNDNSVIKFIHRYNNLERRWFLTAQHCTLGAIQTPGPPADIYHLTHTDKFFDLQYYGHISNTVAGTLDGADDEVYCKSYFQYIRDSLGVVRKANNVHSAAFSWREVMALYDANAIGRDPSRLSIIFRSISSYYNLGLGHSRVTIPHCLVMIMAYDDIELLDNTYVAGNFRNKGADFNSLCPPMNSVFIMPPGL